MPKRSDDSIAKQSLKWTPQVTKEYVEERAWERNVDSEFQVQLEEDEGDSRKHEVVCGLQSEWQGL